MDQNCEVGQKGKDLNAPQKSPATLSIHMECHNLFLGFKLNKKIVKKAKPNQILKLQACIIMYNIVLVLL